MKARLHVGCTNVLHCLKFTKMHLNKSYLKSCLYMYVMGILCNDIMLRCDVLLLNRVMRMDHERNMWC